MPLMLKCDDTDVRKASRLITNNGEVRRSGEPVAV